MKIWLGSDYEIEEVSFFLLKNIYFLIDTAVVVIKSLKLKDIKISSV